LSALFPDKPDAYDHPAEYEVAQRLANLLPSNWQILANIEWSRNLGSGRRTGEIDFIVLTPATHIHVIELTFGILEYDGNGQIVIARPFGKKSKSDQLKHNKSLVIELLKEAHRRGASLPKYFVSAWLLAPRARLLENLPLPGYPFENIVDSQFTSPIEELAARIIRFSGDIDPAAVIESRLTKIFKQELRYYLDPTSLLEGERKYVASFLNTSELLLSMRSDSNRFVIDGVAGSGKTQLALAGISSARSRGKTVALVSNTSVLPSLLKTEYGESFPAFTYFRFKEEGERSYDEIYVEEAHHFEPAAIETIEKRSKPNARLYYLMDSYQNFDARFITPPGAVTVFLDDTYRVPQEIVRTLNLFLPDRKIRCRSPQLDSQLIVHDSFMSDADTFLAAVRSLTSFLDINPELRTHCGIVYCGNQYQLSGLYKRFQSEIDECQDLERSSSVLSSEQLKLDNSFRTNEFSLDTIRRFQGSSNKFIWICGLTKQSTIEGSVRLFYSALTRARARCEVFCTKEFGEQVAVAIN